MRNALRASDPADTTPQLYPPYRSVLVLLDPGIHVLAVKGDALADAYDWDSLVEDEMLDSLLRPAQIHSRLLYVVQPGLDAGHGRARQLLTHQQGDLRGQLFCKQGSDRSKERRVGKECRYPG